MRPEIKIRKSKVFEVYESGEGKFRRIYTESLVPGKKVYGERLVVQDKTEFREWDAYKSKLCAAVLKGCPNIFIRRNDTVLYLGSASGTTVSHVSDIVGEEGFVFAVDMAPRVVRDLMFLCYDRKNIAPILADAHKPDEIAQRASQADVLYQDVAQKDQVDIFLKNIDMFLKDKGYAILALKARSIDVVRRPSDIFKEVKHRLEAKMTLVDYRQLDPFQKDHAFYVCKK
ncbi:fibrillarin-like rRNA/tRNA 2'-O-methyltransferase [Candidatus Woesearchaeota archaeon]|nr:fibrillarin-like rRNA/tRNA 2'-O-methyltransferase [Candidatus Woesearchaeota archaeon]MBI2130713.1 fibrillarin-like rRNA/tRNA 2'-O-methyltransferase [Candidatus Woesearchaeota archaeon]